MQIKSNIKLLASLVVLATSLSAATGYSLDTANCPIMRSGKYKGQCIDISGKRAVKILSQSADSITILNFRKNGQFYKAVIPLDQVASLSYEVIDLNAKPVNFLSLINISHTEMRFRMKQGKSIPLYANTANDGGAPLASEDDMIVSMNYMAPKGVEYDPVKGFDENLYASVLQIFSTDDEAQKRFVEQKLNVYEIKLSIGGAQAAAILKQALMISNRIQYSTPYDTWSSNCTTYLFDIIDAGLKLKNQKPYRFTPLMAADTGLSPGFKALAKRGLVSPDTKVRLLNSEFGYGIFPSNSNMYFNKWIGRGL